MGQLSSEGRLHTTTEFDRWWEAYGQAIALSTMLDLAAAKHLAWEAWRKGREQMNEATTSQRLQPGRR